MNPLINIALKPLLFSVLIACFSTPFVIAFAKKIKIIDYPEKGKTSKKIHKYPVPRGGGLAIFISLLFGSLLFLPADKHLTGILIGAVLLVIVGILDDKYNLNPYLRLFMQFVAAVFPVASGIGISFVTIPFFGLIDLSHPRIVFELFGDQKSIWLISDLFAIFWMVFLMNIINMGAKGVDGQFPGVSAISALTILFLSVKFSADITEWPVIILASVSAGAFLGFLPWNFYPQKIMPGFSGSSLAGYMLAILSILSTAKVGTLLVVLGIPIVDTSYTIARRLLSGKSPVWGDAGHLHHRLLNIGWSKRKVAFFYWGMTFVLGIVALNLNASFKFYTIIGITLFIGGLLLWLMMQNKKQI